MKDVDGDAGFVMNVEALIDRFQAGDEFAGEGLYNLHRDRVFRLAYALLGNREDAEEAAQDALTYALLHIQDYDARRSKFTTWLHMITVSRSRDLQRKRRLPTVPLFRWLRGRGATPSPDPGPEERVVRAEESNSIWEAVQSLSPPLREAIVLRHWGGHTYQEIGEIVGCPLKTAQSRVRLAYQRLEKVFSREGVPDLNEEVL